jgi:DNA polymerase I - 3''-5'' exonuclease and polymerase domains
VPDITKLAMALVYLECKKRGWLHLVKMTVTIHDELVFEIHKSIVEEAVDVITHVMTRNKFILRLKNPIPLKVDVEFGDDWTVPFNLTEMAYNQGGGDWTPELVKLFPNKYAHYLECGGTPLDGVEVPDTDGEDDGGGGVVPTDGNTAVALAGKKQFEKPKVTPKQPYRHVIHSSKLSYGLMEKLAQLIISCEGRGTQPLHLVTESGEPLLPTEQPILVAATEFKMLAERQGF